MSGQPLDQTGPLQPPAPPANRMSYHQVGSLALRVTLGIVLVANGGYLSGLAVELWADSLNVPAREPRPQVGALPREPRVERAAKIWAKHFAALGTVDSMQSTHLPSFLKGSTVRALAGVAVGGVIALLMMALPAPLGLGTGSRKLVCTLLLGAFLGLLVGVFFVAILQASLRAGELRLTFAMLAGLLVMLCFTASRRGSVTSRSARVTPVLFAIRWAILGAAVALPTPYLLYLGANYELLVPHFWRLLGQFAQSITTDLTVFVLLRGALVGAVLGGMAGAIETWKRMGSNTTQSPG